MRGTVAKRLRRMAHAQTMGLEGVVRNEKTLELFAVSCRRELRRLKAQWRTKTRTEKKA